MKRGESLGLALLLFLGWLAACYAVRIAEHFQTGGRLALELGRAHLTRLEPATLARLDDLSASVFVTYYVSPADRMPSSMRHVERRVTDLLEALRNHAPERFDFQIVDPETDPELAGFAARRKVAPFRVRSLEHDAYSEQTVWSALTLAYGSHPEALLSGIGPDQIPRLQRTLVTWLDQLERPRQAVIALAAPPGFGELAQALAARGELIEARLDEGEPPPEADLLVWMQPRRVTDATLAALDRFLERGGSVLVAGGRLTARSGSIVASEKGPAVQLFPSGQALDELLPHFGLQPRPGLFLDERCDSLDFEGAEHAAPFLVRCIAPNQDFHSFPTLPNGTLLFTAPTPLALDDATLRDRGWNAEVLATTSELTWSDAEPLPPAPPKALADMVRSEERSVPRQPLIVGLRHQDPWRGRLIVCAQTTPFEDGLFRRENVAHPRLLSSILEETLADERLVVTQAHVERAAPLPPLGPAARVFWRFACVFLLPALLLLRLLHGGVSPRPLVARGALRLALVSAGVVVALVGLRAAAAFPPRLDATSAGLNRLAPETVAIAARAGASGTIAARLVLSPNEVLPPGLRGPARDLRRLLADLEQAGADLELDTDLSAGEASPVFQTATRDGDLTTVRRFRATLELERAGRTETLHFPDARAFEGLEFRLAFALWRLTTGRRPHVAFASDVPRLSAAEAYEHYQQKGLFAPQGADVYSLARETLATEGFRVTHVDPRQPELPADVDLLVWMQPRRSTIPMLKVMLRHLIGGGRVFLAAQHFNIQSQQFRGAAFDLFYWPRPQTPDVEELYFPELSIELVREVLFDERSTRIETETQITGRSASRDFEAQTSALPFLIRVAAANYDPDSPITRNLGDQAFVWGNYLRWDAARLAELGLTARSLMTTSERTWTYAWKGGYLPDERLAGPDGPFLGKLPLAVLFAGTFPAPARPLAIGVGEAQAEAPLEDWPASRPGELLFVGGSELFKDQRLLDPEFRADQFLWNAAAALALEPELAAIASRRRVAPGFDYVAPRSKLAWRAGVVGAGPLLLVALGALVALRRRRPLAWRNAA